MHGSEMQRTKLPTGILSGLINETRALIMSIRSMTAKITGINPLLMNNPQTVDRFNPYAKAMKKITEKGKKRTDEDYLDLRDIEVRSKIYFDDSGVYVPSTWMLAAIAKVSFKTTKNSKHEIRGSVFTTRDKLPLTYRDMAKVKKPEDIVGNPDFRILLTLKQGQDRVVKAVPIFHEWSFTCGLEYDDKTIDQENLARIIKHAATYGGFGDFRPTFGRATAEVSHD